MNTLSLLKKEREKAAIILGAGEEIKEQERCQLQQGGGG